MCPCRLFADEALWRYRSGGLRVLQQFQPFEFSKVSVRQQKTTAAAPNASAAAAAAAAPSTIYHVTTINIRRLALYERPDQPLPAGLIVDGQPIAGPLPVWSPADDNGTAQAHLCSLESNPPVWSVCTDTSWLVEERRCVNALCLARVEQPFPIAPH